MAPPRALDSLDVAIVMPAYNEADGIGEFLAEIEGAVAPLVRSLAFVVVDDCSTDGTWDVLEKARAALDAPVALLRNERNRGHGPTATRAYREGLATGAALILHVDGDGQYGGSDLLRVLRHLAAGCDAVIGRRHGRSEPWFRRVITDTLRLELWAVARVAAADPNCPLRGYDRDVLGRLLDGLPPDTLVPNVYMTVLEVRAGLDRLELPVAGLPRRGAADTGTMWGSGGRRRLPPRRLLRFVVASGRESLRMIPELGRGARGGRGFGAGSSAE